MNWLLRTGSSDLIPIGFSYGTKLKRLGTVRKLRTWTILLEEFLPLFLSHQISSKASGLKWIIGLKNVVLYRWCKYHKIIRYQTKTVIIDLTTKSIFCFYQQWLFKYNILKCMQPFLMTLCSINCDSINSQTSMNYRNYQQPWNGSCTMST